MYWSQFYHHVLVKGAGNIKYGDIKNWEIEKKGTSKKSGELNFKMPQYRFVENYKKCLITGFLGTKKNTSIPVV